jgi:hypothetical protein
MIRMLAIAAVLALPATAAARTWRAPQRVAPSGYDPQAAIGQRDGTGVVYATQAGGRYSVLLRRGTGVLGAATTVVRSPDHVDSPQLTFEPGNGIAVVAWRQLHGSWGLRLRRIRPGFPADAIFDFAGGSDSVLFPRFVPGPFSLVAWERRSGAGAASYVRFDHTVDEPLALPAGATEHLAMVATNDGAVTAAWTQNGTLYAASGNPATGFGASAPISPPGGYARDPQLVGDRSGDVTAVWTDSHGQGNAVLAATRPPGGAFGPATQVERSSYGATSVQATLANDGTVLVTFVATRRSFPIAFHSGTVRFARLDASGRRVGAPRTISPPGVRTTGIVAGAQEVAWARGGRIYTRQLAGDGTLGPVQSLATGVAPVELSLAANATNRAVLAYVAGGAVYAATRP